MFIRNPLAIARNYFVLLLVIAITLNITTIHASPIEQAQNFQEVDSLLHHRDFERANRLLETLIQQGQVNHDAWLSGKAYAALGSSLLMQGKADLALKNYLTSLQLLDEKEYPKEVSKIYANVGALHSQLKRFSEAEQYLLKALQLNPSKEDRLKYLTNLSGVYLESGQKQKALHTFNEAIALGKAQKNKAVEAILYTNLSNYYLEQKQWDRAINHAQKSLELRAELRQAPSVITLNNLGYALTQQKKYREGILCYLQALPYASLQEKKQLYYNLYQANKLSGENGKSLQYIEAYDQIKDSLTTLNYRQKVAELDAQYQAKERQRKIEQLAATNTLQGKQLRQQAYLIIAGLMILALISLVVFLRWRHTRLKEQLEKSQLKYRFLLVQLNPHFIFNALQSVQRFIFRNDQQQSMEYLQRFSRLIRLVLENSAKDVISLDEELELLDNYLRLQQLNAEPAFTYEITVTAAVERELTVIPTMLLQPLVENAVVHGLKGRTNGRIALLFSNDGNKLRVLIQDNGVGFLQEKQANALHKSMSTDMLRQRIEEINKMGKQHIEFKLVNKGSEASPGTTIQLTVTS
ncbi:tetratricopeptide repeat protein [Olivibacter ginsenosidimutans]